MTDGWRRLGAPLGAALAVILGASSSGIAAPEDPLAAYRWQSRLLVVSAPTPDDARLDAQRAVLSAAGTGARERDLVTMEAVGRGARAETLRRRLGLPADSFRAVLVGKDGGAKLASDEPISADRLFRVIDAMPMRRDEIQRR